MSIQKLCIVAGYSGSGKTLVARRLAQALPNAALLDKDTLTSPLAEELLLALGQKIEDRESDVYIQKVRPFEYECLLTTAFENLSLGKDVVASGPFLLEIANPMWLENFGSHVRERGARLVFIWVKSDGETMRKNLEERGAYRDRFKLSHWEEYVETIQMEPDFLPQETYVFDHTRGQLGAFEKNMAALVAHCGR